MKKLSLLCIFFNSVFFVSAQDSSFTIKFMRSLVKEFAAVRNIENDTCANKIVLIRLFIDSQCKVSMIEYSDNAPDRVKEELVKIKHKLAVQDIEDYFKQKKQNNINLIVPFYIINEDIHSSCWPVVNLYNLNTFHKKNLSGNCLIAAPFVWILHPLQY